ncbi:protein phosphatase 1 regulatory subunit 35 isoform X2 [Brienomyrus brachyistius]|uniref:protein phosphatase 1 regulatory subunit 35 isoform X2 n=1 Tax=Brienomyrus brachyistius TaxID=42636 RepID=UPI0020B386E9|nr:protein phosphatase 1 regulatory subunit 35 isoform X2 [Brienomyrus brachyistius]
MTEKFSPMDGPEMPQAPPVPAGCSRLTTHPDLDLSVTLTPERPSIEPGILKQGKRRGRRPQRQVRFTISPKPKETVIKFSRTPAEEHVVRTAVIEPGSQQEAIQTTRGSKNHNALNGRKSGKKGGGPEPPVKEGVSVCGLAEEGSGKLCQGAELNTTLALKAELEDLAEKEFDPKRAVQQRLKASVYTKSNISVRATEGVNIPRCQNLYRELVSISVPEDQLISQALHDRLKLVPPPPSNKV